VVFLSGSKSVKVLSFVYICLAVGDPVIKRGGVYICLTVGDPVIKREGLRIH
jgi:hypothetical protein